MTQRTCLIEGCERPHQARGWCKIHYLRWYKHGDPLIVKPPRWEGYVRPTCSVDGCDSPAHGRGLCTIHGPRNRRHGDPEAGRRRNFVGTPEDQYWAFVEKRGADDCWLWTGSLITGGYAQMRIPEAVYAHRWAYEHFVGPIPDGLVIDHTCHNRDLTCHSGPCPHRRCVNWRHLEPVTDVVNFRRGYLRKQLAKGAKVRPR